MRSREQADSLSIKREPQMPLREAGLRYEAQVYTDSTDYTDFFFVRIRKNLIARIQAADFTD